MTAVPLSILDLSPITTGTTPADAYRNTVDLARHAETFGYQRYWLAEHHFDAGVASSVPALLIAQVAGATKRIRVGSGAVQVGHQTALGVVEQFGVLDALFPGRIDLGLGRSGQRRAEAMKELQTAAAPAARDGAALGPSATATPEPRHESKIVDGLLIPPPFPYARLVLSPRMSLHASLLQQPGAESPDFAEQVGDILALLNGSYHSSEGLPVHAMPGEGANVAVLIFGSSPGQSAQVAGARGLPFVANYHVSPATVLDSVAAYRAAFRPSCWLPDPYVIASADAVVAVDDEAARRLASPFGLWVRSIRTGEGAMPFPTPAEAAQHDWTDEDRLLVADRVETQFVGSPTAVADGLRVLQAATGADELVVTTITHDHADRVRSFELLAEEWGLSGQ